MGQVIPFFLHRALVACMVMVREEQERSILVRKPACFVEDIWEVIGEKGWNNCGILSAL